MFPDKKRLFLIYPHKQEALNMTSDRLWRLLNEIESFLLTCTYDERCRFWNSINNLRQNFQKRTRQAEVPNFLNHRRRKRNFCRILEVLADLSYPKLHLSNHSG